MKTVASGAHYTTVEVDTAEAVKFSFPSTSLSVEASGGDITVALTDTAQAGDDETITVPDGESRMFIHHRMNVDTYYLTGSGTAKLYASNMGDVNPFKAGKRGGDSGGDNTHYKGTTTTALENGSTTNPIVIDGESYTAVFGDVVVYGYTEFVFDGTAWSEFGRPFDTVPTQGSMNAVTSDGVYRNTAGRKYFVGEEVRGVSFGSVYSKASGVGSLAEGFNTTASGSYSHSEGSGSNASNNYSHAEGQTTTASGGSSHSEGRGTIASGASSHAGGFHTIANKENSTVIGKYNVADTDVTHLFIVGNGTEENNRSNILEVSETDMNVNGDIKVNNVSIPIPYTTMPTITADMLGKIAMYVGATGNGYTQGCFYVAATDGAAEPTYSWVQIGGGRTETVLWENTGTTNPDTITLSEAWSDFDELVAVTGWVENNTYIWGYTTIQNTYNIGDMVRLWYYDNYVYGMYTITSSTILTRHAVDGSNWISKIIGIKY
jgi:hypothetical protein